MLKAEGCLLVTTHQTNWGVNCMGGTGEPFKKPGLILPKQGRLLTVPALQIRRLRPEGPFRLYTEEQKMKGNFLLGAGGWL